MAADKSPGLINIDFGWKRDIIKKIKKKWRMKDLRWIHVRQINKTGIWQRKCLWWHQTHVMNYLAGKTKEADGSRERLLAVRLKLLQDGTCSAGSVRLLMRLILETRSCADAATHHHDPSPCVGGMCWSEHP